MEDLFIRAHIASHQNNLLLATHRAIKHKVIIQIESVDIMAVFALAIKVYLSSIVEVSEQLD